MGGISSRRTLASFPAQKSIQKGVVSQGHNAFFICTKANELFSFVYRKSRQAALPMKNNAYAEYLTPKAFALSA